ncbi:MAG: RNA polymerase sigma factor [Candidatus Paceibacterota bacterium]
MNLKQKIKRQLILTLAHNDFEKGLNLHAFFKVHDHQISEDLVQDTFMKTWIYLVRGGKISMMKAFLYHILNHLIIDEYRKHKNISLDVLLEKGLPEPDTGRTNRQFNILDGKTAFALIGLLPFKYQKIMKMKYIQDLSLKEMSLITGQSTRTIAVQIHRGLEKLKLLYNPT